MIKIKMFTASAGPEGTIQAGQEIRLEEKEAKALVDGGYAEYVEEPTPEKKERRRGGPKTNSSDDTGPSGKSGGDENVPKNG